MTDILKLLKDLDRFTSHLSNLRPSDSYVAHQSPIILKDFFLFDVLKTQLKKDASSAQLLVAHNLKSQSFSLSATAPAEWFIVQLDEQLKISLGAPHEELEKYHPVELKARTVEFTVLTEAKGFTRILVVSSSSHFTVKEG